MDTPHSTLTSVALFGLPVILLSIISSCLNMKTFSHTHGSPLQAAFTQPEAIMVLLSCSIAVTAAMSLELVADFFFSPDFIQPPDLFERMIVLLSAIVPGCVCLFAVLSHHVDMDVIFVLCHMVQFVGFSVPMFSMPRKAFPTYFTFPKTAGAYLCWFSGCTIVTFDLHFDDVTFWKRGIALTMLVLSQTIFLHTLHQAITNYMKQKQLPLRMLLHEFDETEICCFWYIVIAQVILGGTTTFYNIIIRLSILQADLKGVLFLICVHASYTAATSLIPGRAKLCVALKLYNERMLKEAASRAIRDTVRYLSHEIRNPLHGIQNGVELLKDELKNFRSKQVTSTLKDVFRASSIATAVLNDLLNFEKICSGSFSVDRKLFHASPFLVRMVKGNLISARKKGIECLIINQLESDDTPLLLGIKVDRIKFDQVIRNLLSNAIKFTPRGGKISITLRRDSESQPYDDFNSSQISKVSKYLSKPPGPRKMIPRPKLSKIAPEQFVQNRDSEIGIPHHSSEYATVKKNIIIEIADTGCGLTSTQCRQLFTPFVQFNANTNQRGGGSGLGLWICKEIIKQHKGQLKVHSLGVGLGATFTVHLPSILCSDNEVSNCSSLSGKGVSGTGFSSASFWANEEEKCELTEALSIPLDILIVDDVTFNRKILAHMITKSWEHICDEDAFNKVYPIAISNALDGDKAVEIIRNIGNKVQIVFLDNIMVRLNGPEAAQQMRQLKYTGEIVGVTASNSESEVAHFLQAGANEVLIKPVSPHLISKVLLRVAKKLNSHSD